MFQTYSCIRIGQFSWTIYITYIFQLKSLSGIKAFLSSHDLEKVIHDFISSLLGYCNALRSGLQLSGTKKTGHNTSVLASRHWPPVNLRIQYEVLLLGPVQHSRHSLHT